MIAIVSDENNNTESNTGKFIRNIHLYKDVKSRAEQQKYLDNAHLTAAALHPLVRKGWD